MSFRAIARKLFEKHITAMQFEKFSPRASLSPPLARRNDIIFHNNPIILFAFSTPTAS